MILPRSSSPSTMRSAISKPPGAWTAAFRSVTGTVRWETGSQSGRTRSTRAIGAKPTACCRRPMTFPSLRAEYARLFARRGVYSCCRPMRRLPFATTRPPLSKRLFPRDMSRLVRRVHAPAHGWLSSVRDRPAWLVPTSSTARATRSTCMRKMSASVACCDWAYPTLN